MKLHYFGSLNVATVFYLAVCYYLKGAGFFVCVFCSVSQSCIDCDKYPTVPLAVFFLLLFIVLAVAFSMALVLNIGVTAPLDSWLFFSQVRNMPLANFVLF